MAGLRPFWSDNTVALRPSGVKLKGLEKLRKEGGCQMRNSAE